MSLINDALRKAQRERSGSAQPPASTTPSAPGPGYHPAAKPATNLWPIAIAAVALVGGGAAVWFLKPGAPAPVTMAASVQSATPSLSPTPEAPAAPAPTAEPDALQLRINLPGTSAPLAAPALPPPPPTPVAAPTTPDLAPSTAPAAPFQITLQLEDPRILAFLDNARISGIRIAADDAKLLMNGKVYRAGDVVDRELGLKVVIIRPAELVFEDKRGIQYRKVL